ncbi:MAG: LysR family transcriptional regulator [Pygmaiobacter massiliensis]|nr:LysR family transcriptional regulator [Pygmaiobacter massiliensis]
MYISYDAYRVFYYVARCGSFSQAADQLYASQPNLTRTIKKLEQTLGCSLFTRSSRGVELTPEGHILYARVSAAVSQLQAGEAELARELQLEVGTVAIAASEIALKGLLLPVLQQFGESWPGIRLRVLDHTTPQAVAALQKRTVDLAVVTSPIQAAEGLQCTVLTRFQNVAVCSPAQAAHIKQPLTPRQLARLPLVCQGAGTGTHTLYREWYARYQLPFEPEVETSTSDQVLPLVEAGLGIGLVPDFYAREGLSQGRLVQLSLTSFLPQRQICLVQEKNRRLGTAARRLEEILLQQALQQKSPAAAL